MAIASDPFAPPKAIGQGLTPIQEPTYGGSSASGLSLSSPGLSASAAGPFSDTGVLGQTTDTSRAGLSSLLETAGITPPTPVGDIGLPSTGKSPVSTSGLSAITSAGIPTSGAGSGSGSAESQAGVAAPNTQEFTTSPFTGVPSSVSNIANAGKLTSTGLGLLSAYTSAIPASALPALGIFSTLAGVPGLPLGVAGLGNTISNFVGNNAALSSFNKSLNSMTAEEANATLNALAKDFASASQSISSGQLTTVSDPTLAAALGRAGFQGFPFQGQTVFGGTMQGGVQSPIGFGFQGPQGAAYGLSATNPSIAGQNQTLDMSAIGQALAQALGLTGRGAEPDTGSGPTGDTAGPGAGTATGDSSTGGDPGGSTYGRGGLVRNLHPGGGDDEPAKLEAGEFVVRAPAVKRVGLGRLMALNQKGT